MGRPARAVAARRVAAVHRLERLEAVGRADEIPASLACLRDRDRDGDRDRDRDRDTVGLPRAAVRVRARVRCG